MVISVIDGGESDRPTNVPTDVDDDDGDVDETEVSRGGRDGANDKRADAFEAAAVLITEIFLFR